MPYKDFQSEDLGARLSFPYLAGPGATIVSVQPSNAWGDVRSDSGFVGLDVGVGATIEFDPPVAAFRMDLFAGANPTIATVVHKGGARSQRTLAKGPLQTGSIAYAGSGIAAVVLSHRDRKGLLLRLDWDNGVDVTLASSNSSIAVSTHLAGMIYARTASWRARHDKVAELETARSELALSILAVDAIIPSEVDLRHLVVRAIWQSCLTAANAALSGNGKQSACEVVVERFSGDEMGLGPFIDLRSKGTEIMVVRRR